MKKKKTKKRANYNEGIPIDPTKVKSVVEVPFKQINPKLKARFNQCLLI